MKAVLAILALADPVQETVAFHAIEPFDLHRLILARGIGQSLAIRALGR